MAEKRKVTFSDNLDVMRLAVGGQLSTQDQLFLQNQPDIAKLNPQAQYETLRKMPAKEINRRLTNRLITPPAMAEGGKPSVELNYNIPFEKGGEVKMAGAGSVFKAAAKAAKESLPQTEREANLARLLEPSAVKERLYHGTKGDIKSFDLSKRGSSDLSSIGGGVYLTQNPNVASLYAKLVPGESGANVMPVYAQVKNPYGFDRVTPFKSQAEANEFSRRLQEAGYDSIIKRGPDNEITELVVFEPNKIKSAIGNRGTYDINEPDITKAGGGSVEQKFNGGGVAFDIPTPENIRLSQEIAEQEERERQARDAKLSPLDRLYSGYEAARTIGSGLMHSVGSLPTLVREGPEAAKQYIAENIYLPKTEKGIEYLENVGQGLENLETKYKIPPILPQVAALEGIAKPAAKQAIRAAGEVMPPMSGSGVRGLAYQEGAIKPFGGEWLKDPIFDKPPAKTQHLQAIERDLQDPNISAENKEVLQRNYTHLKNTDALKRWEKGNLANYIKNKMGTQEDPIRELAEKGITHIPQDPDWNEYVGVPASVIKKRQEAGLPAEGVGKSPLARLWETMADEAIFPEKASTYQAASQARDRLSEMQPDLAAGVERVNRSFEESLRNSGLPASEVKNRSLYTHVADKARLVGDKDFESLWGEQDRLNKILSGTTGYIAKQNPWISKLDPDEPVYRAKIRNLGFDHVLDVLREDMNAGRIRPDQLNKMSVEDAIKRTYEYDQAMAKKMRETTASLREGLPVYKEYPKGFRWIELNKPGSFAHESDMMGHSVRGYEPPKGHEDWVEASKDFGSESYGHGGWEAIKSGRAKVYSLVDSKGNPHVTVEVAASGMTPEQRQNKIGVLADRLQKEGKTAEDALRQAEKIYPEERKETITQIKGKQNAAPKEDYLPFVQDFVKSGNWYNVGDFKNTGLINIDPKSDLAAAFKKSGKEPPKYVSQDELTNLLKWSRGEGDLPSGFKRGGKVHFSDNPDVMQLELGGGGKAISASAKLARAAAKSRQEIEKIADRMAPQVTGEYVRQSPEKAVTVAGKTKKQFEREKDLNVDIRPTAEEKVVAPVDIESLKGSVLMGVPGDATVTGRTLHGVGDVRLESPSPQHGGPLYGLYQGDDKFWASGLGAATRVQNLANEIERQYGAPVVGKYIMMGPEGINYAQHFADANLQAIDLGKMTANQIEGFNNLIRKGSAKSGPRPSFPGIEDKGSAYLHFSVDPELRKHFNALMQQPKVVEAFSLPSGQDIRMAVTEPPLRNLETGVSGFSLGRMNPSVESSKLKLSAHPTYSHDIPGEFIGGMRYPVPYELSFADTLKAVRENPAQAPQEFGSLKMVGPRQIVDQQMIDELKTYEEFMKRRTGKKKGGAVKKGKVTVSDSRDVQFLSSLD